MGRCRAAPALPGAPIRSRRRADGAPQRRHAGRRCAARRARRARSARSGCWACVATVFLMVGRRRRRQPSQYVPARSGGWPGWLAGPLAGLDMSLGSGTLSDADAGRCARLRCSCSASRARCRCARSCAAIVAAHVDPAARAAADLTGRVRLPRLRAPGRAARPRPVHALRRRSPRRRRLRVRRLALPALALRPAVHARQLRDGAARRSPARCGRSRRSPSPSSLGAVALIARAAGELGHSRRWAAAFVGLNPVLLVLAVGGAHNDTLIVLAARRGAGADSAAPAPRLRGGRGARSWRASAIKLTAGAAAAVPRARAARAGASARRARGRGRAEPAARSARVGADRLRLARARLPRRRRRAAAARRHAQRPRRDRAPVRA